MQLQLIATQRPAQLALEIGHAPGVAVDAFVEDMEGAALRALGLLHGDVRVPHQRVGATLCAGMGDTETGTDQQAFAVDPIGFGQGFCDALGHPLGALRRAAGIDQQGEFVAAQARQLITGLQLTFQPGDDLQDQTVAGLMPEGVVGMTKVVEIEMSEGQAAPVVFCQPRGEQGLKALAIGDAGQRILFSEALQSVFENAALTHMTQATAQHAGIEGVEHQPVADANGRSGRFVFQQQHGRQAATARGRLQRGNGQQHRMTVVFEQTADRLPARRADQHRRAPHRSQTLAQ